MSLSIRIMGTEDECSVFCAVVRKNIPKEYLRSISKFYPNRRQTYSNEGRIYIYVDLPPETHPTRRDP